jgi:hypothetical protein
MVYALLPRYAAPRRGGAVLLKNIVEIIREHAAGGLLATANALIPETVARSLVFAALHPCIVHGPLSLQVYAGMDRLGTASAFIPGSVAPGGAIVEQLRSIVNHILISQILQVMMDNAAQERVGMVYASIQAIVARSGVIVEVL